jgi:hypothetical protein
MSTDRVTTYSADLTTLVVAGLTIDSGYADGEFVSVEPVSDDYSDKVGADGEVARAKTNDRRTTVKVKLLQGSLGNTLLSQLRALALDPNNANGADVGTFLLKDRSSGVQLAHGDKCWIMKPPTVNLARETSEREWTLRVAITELTPEGSPSV